MRKTYGFVILDIDCLVDLKGLLTYLAERIHIGNLCLFCSKQFKDGARCQQHMIDKGHCMMNMEDEDEYVDFYDFSKTYENHPLAFKKLKNDSSDSIKESNEEDENESWASCDEDDIDSEEGDKKIDHDDVSFEIKSKTDGTDSTLKDFVVVNKDDGTSEPKD